MCGSTNIINCGVGIVAVVALVAVVLVVKLLVGKIKAAREKAKGDGNARRV